MGILLMIVGFCLGGVKGRTYAVNTTKEIPRHKRVQGYSHHALGWTSVLSSCGRMSYRGLLMHLVDELPTGFSD